MGVPSISIYAHELITHFGVKQIVRIGTCGALSKHVKVRDIVIALGACTDSNVNRVKFKGYDYAATADYFLVEKLVNATRKKGIKFKNITFSTL